MIIGYLRGAADGIGRASMQRFALENNISLSSVLEDSKECFKCFRQLQTMVKLHMVKAVLIRGEADLGDDRYMALESRLFFERNGVRLIYMQRPFPDRRHDIALHIRRYFSRITETDEEYGTMLPLRNTRRTFLRIPPFGYDVKEGVPVINESEAEAVRMIFSRYSSGASIAEILRDLPECVSRRGKSFGNMTVKTVLKNERYLGRLSKKGYHLPSIVTYDSWLAVKERLEKDYLYETDPEPYLKNVRRLCRVRYYRNSCFDSMRHTESLEGNAAIVDSDALESAIESIVSSYCTPENAERFFTGYVLNERRETEAALIKAEEEYASVSREFTTILNALIGGARGDEEQEKLEELTDRKNIYGMRKRRIISEKDLFSITPEQVNRFFERGRNISGLSLEERAYIAEAFVKRIAISEAGATAFVVSPKTGKLKRIVLDGIVK